MYHVARGGEPMDIDAAYALSDARAAPLSQTRNLKMARSSHAYMRGNTIKFYEWLESSERRNVAERTAGLDLRRLSHRQSWTSR